MGRYSVRNGRPPEHLAGVVSIKSFTATGMPGKWPQILLRSALTVDPRSLASSLVGQNIGECLQRWVKCVDAGEDRFCQFAGRDSALRQGPSCFTERAIGQRRTATRRFGLSLCSTTPVNTTSGLDVACSNQSVPPRSDRSSELRPCDGEHSTDVVKRLAAPMDHPNEPQQRCKSTRLQLLAYGAMPVQ